MTYYGNNNIRRVAERLKKEREAREARENYKASAKPEEYSSEPSAPVVNNRAPIAFNESLGLYVYQDLSTGKFYDGGGKELPPEVASLYLQAITSSNPEVQKGILDRISSINSGSPTADGSTPAQELDRLSNKTIRKYIENTQAYLINNVEKISNATRDKETRDKDIVGLNIHKLKDDIAPGAFGRYISNKTFKTPKGDALLSPFIHATPAQLAILQPLLRLFMVDQDGNEEEIFFSDHTTEKFAKNIADLRSGGTIEDTLSPRSQRGSDSGIKSFTWNYNNKHEGDYIIEAQLQLYFGTLTELANINYLQFLFQSGGSSDLAKDIPRQATTNRKKEENKQATARTSQQRARHKLVDKINRYSAILRNGNKNLKRLQDMSKEDVAARKKEFRQLKVIVGWSEPKGSREQLIGRTKTFKSQTEYDNFIQGIRASSRAIFLNLYDYNVEFQQEGPTVLTINYLGSTDNYLATGAADVFGSNNYKEDNQLMYKPTRVSVEGFVNYEDKIVDVEENNNPAAASAALAGGRGASPLSVEDPYLNSVPIGKNSQGEPTLTVTLAGLKAAQELALSQIKLANLTNKDPEGELLTRIRRRGEFIVLLYQRALNTRLRDLYSQFLRRIIDDGSVYRAEIILPQDNRSKKAILNLNSSRAPERDRGEQLRQLEKELQMSLPRDSVGESQSFDPEAPEEQTDDNSVVVYYMKFGDLLKAGILNSDLRKDATFILGNMKNKSGNEFSLYDLPITLETFGQFFYNRVVASKLRQYPYRTFLEDMLGIAARVINNSTEVSERISFDYTVISSAIPNSNLPFVLDQSTLEKVGDGEADPLSSRGKKFNHFYTIFPKRASHRNRKGLRDDDEREGIFHYVIGSDKGLAKNYNFSRQETQFFQEMLIESNNAEDQIQALFLPQNVNINMYGNQMHKNGDLIFVDSRPSLGSFAGPVLGIGGYYRVIRSSHVISNRGYETSLDCVFELRVIN